MRLGASCSNPPKGWTVKRKVSLFVPCFVDQLVPEVAVDTVKVLRRMGMQSSSPKIRLVAGSLLLTPGTGTRRGRVQSISFEFSNMLRWSCARPVPA